MSTQLSFKSTVRRSSRLNPSLKKKLGFQKLEIEFSSKSRKRPRNDSKVSPVLFDSPDDPIGESQKADQHVEFSVANGSQSEDANSQVSTAQFTDALSHGSVASSADAIRKFVNGGLNTQDFADEIKEFAEDSPSPGDLADASEKLANDGPKSGDVEDAIGRFVNDSLNSQNYVGEMRRPPNDGPCAADLAEEMKKLVNADLNSQDFTDEMAKSTDPNLSFQNFAAPRSPNIKSTRTRRVQPALKSKPVRGKAPGTVCDGNILPESFRKSTARATTRSEAVKCASQRARKSRINCEPVVPGETNGSSESAKSLRPDSDPPRKRKRGTSAAAKPAKRKSRNTHSGVRTPFEPLNIEIISQKTVPCETNVSFEPVKNLQPLPKPKRGRKPRASAAAKPATNGKSRSTFVEPQQVETGPRKTRPYARKPKPICPVDKSRTRLAEQKQTVLASAEVELCSLFSNCSVKSGEDVSTPRLVSQSAISHPRQYSNVGATAFVNLSLSELYGKDCDLARVDDLSEFSDIFSMKLNVGNFSENLNIMSVLRRVTKIEKKLPHFVPLGENWYENFEIW